MVRNYIDVLTGLPYRPRPKIKHDLAHAEAVLNEAPLPGLKGEGPYS